MTSDEFRILLVDDEPDILEFMGYNLRHENYLVETAQSGIEAIQVAKSFRPDLILLDVMMPGMDGIETCEHIRRTPEIKDVLIAFLTARSEDYSQLSGFAAGGDDYIIKPMKPKILSSRIKALLRRGKTNKPEAEENQGLRFGDMTIDRTKYLVTVSGKEVQLPRKEFELLSLLASKPGRVLVREEIFRLVWGEDVVIGERTIDVHIRKLREKLGQEYITTIKGIGYKFNPNQSS
jgi:two-component system, OmpR family, alkaline phosphatase synthesis response regulator PhoP